MINKASAYKIVKINVPIITTSNIKPIIEKPSLLNKLAIIAI